MPADTVVVELEMPHGRPVRQERWSVVPETHCPHCGSKTVWCEDGEGDFYDGPEYCCITCGAFGVQWTGEPNTNPTDLSRLEQIRKAVEHGR